MGKELIIAREKEKALLEKCLAQKEAQLVVVYGRRRVGKTFLVNQFFDNHFAFKITGAYKEEDRIQRMNFINELNEKANQEYEIPENWNKAFLLLRRYLESLPSSEKQIVFFDEMPWLNVENSDFLSSFEHFWNNYGSSKNNLILIVCGSNTSWLIKNIIYNKGGLFNRQSARIYLEQFNLYETEKYLLEKGFHYSRYDILEIYMIIGGIPYYLNYLNSSLSLNQNIDNMFFSKKALLHDEFDKLYRTLFNEDDTYVDIVNNIYKKKNGLTREEIASSIKKPLNGLLSKMLDTLVKSDFIRQTSSYYQGRKRVIYRVSDYFTMFYLQFMKNKVGVDNHYWQNSYNQQSRNVWAGLMFENVCFTHIEQIKRKLGISGVLSTNYSWNYAGDDVISGAQIDLIIDRKDRTINLCEVKHSIGEFEIDKEYDSKLRQKINTYQTISKTKKSILLTLITTYGVKNNIYSGIVNQSVVMDDLFEK